MLRAVSEVRAMVIKNILVPLARDSIEEAGLNLAMTVARAHEARLTALYMLPGVKFSGYLPIYFPEILEEVIVEQRRRAEEAAEVAKTEFFALAEREGVKAEWRQADGDPRDVVALNARCADLVLVMQSDREKVSNTGYDLAEELVMSAGRPVLAVPYAGRFPQVGETVLVAWKPTREATRAVHDAMPFLERAEKVIVYSVNSPDANHIAGADICTHLARHGVKAEAHHAVATDIEVGDTLLSAASDYGVDMVVMGAYGHSRLRELVLGGATRSLLHHMTVPVLMAH
jgi:nucleotide-binding universal stress UspA family protein